jgi:trans-aconitate 2-methyltransferase
LYRSGVITWDPDHYEEFFAQRHQPGRDLIARIDLVDPATIVDLGCGTGRLTAELALRWPDASVTGIDRSAEMIAATARTMIGYQVGDIETWEPPEPVDLVFANASLHWIDDHASLFPRLVSMLRPGGELAVQMPLSWDQPSHRILRSVGVEFGVEIASPPTLDPGDYHEVLLGRAATEVWVTTYHHVLTGDNPVFRWVSATGMQRFLNRIETERHGAYRDECARQMAAAYPPNNRDETVFPFTRLFLLARAF